MRLRPEAEFIDNRCDPTNLDTIALTYIGSDLPSQQDMDNELIILLAEKTQIEINKQELITAAQSYGLNGITLAQAEDYIDNQINGVTDIDSLKIAIKKVLKKLTIILIK